MSNEPSVKVMSKRLPRALENVCMAMDEECQMYAVGSKVNEPYAASIAMLYVL